MMKLHKSSWYCLAPVLFTILSIDAGAVAPGSPPPGRQPLRMQSLDGPWHLVLDPKDIGKTQVWFKPDVFPLQISRPIEVPASITEIDPKYDGVFWCSRSFRPALAECRDLRHYLQFGAVAYACDVWLNGTLLGSHEGGQSPFEFDVSGKLLADRPNCLVLRIGGPFVAVWGGINQHVTLVAQPAVRIRDMFAEPDIAAGRIQLHVTLENHGDTPADVALQAAIGEFKPRRALGIVTGKTSAAHGSTVATLTIPLKHPHLWNLDDPFLYTIEVSSDWLGAASPEARRDSRSLRSGLRDFRIVDGYFHLNGKRVYLKSAHANHYDPITVFSNGKEPNHWLALGSRGDQNGDRDWLYHKDVIAKPHAITAGLQTKIMTPDYYGELLADTKFFRNVTPPDSTVAVGIRCVMDAGECSAGVMLGTWRHHAGRFTLNSLNLLGNLGHPAADRLLLNLLAHARATAAPLQALPGGYEAELDGLGIRQAVYIFRYIWPTRPNIIRVRPNQCDGERSWVPLRPSPDHRSPC